MTCTEYLLSLDVHTRVMNRPAPTVEEMRAEAQNVWATQPNVQFFSSLGGFSAAMGKPEGDQFRVSTPAYATSLDEMVSVEQHLRQTPEHWDHYVFAVMHLTNFDPLRPDTYTLGECLSASAQTRCLAALVAVGARDLDELLAARRAG
ncbi:hypothetical protein [Deinococcus soli (ex Cha et al. 2016)]|uniref:Uncharacterized protein n=2 Tax=Deinococcus soli (ex Cha et al. 2016) TaxID=1309411 RepID=A0ACC6KKD0_9DEIO|nr:hypothetical protein [Deinococcus soli (ex Cha et al. 2016)]MDR6218659.1 hypothetical protein [Deinococcus soli (ex Cha et al. 2016)]MDR6328456.1 hypothetical protein [Deinococcus soli (ex Cha et al. 2016)]MDR6753067.1 hypothetical protein [Deinococcus soli (ex Cha et al. 2016)]